MKSITKKYLRDGMIVGCEFIDLGIIEGHHWWISFSKVEEDLIYYNFGYELVDSDDIIFTTINYGLRNIEEFFRYVNESKKQIFGDLRKTS